MGMVHAELKERRKQAVLDHGEEWIDPEEQEAAAMGGSSADG